MLGFSGSSDPGGNIVGEFGGSVGHAGGTMGAMGGWQGGYTGPLGPPAAGPMAGIQMGSGIGHDTMGNFSVSMPGGLMGGPPIDTMVSGGSGPALSGMGPMTSPGFEMGGSPVGGAYNANNMGGGMPGGAPGGLGPPPGAGQMPGDVEGGGGEPLIRRLQGLTPEQQNYLLSDPNALRAFNREYDRIIQSGQGGQVGVGQMGDADYEYGQYNVPPSGLISQGTNNDFGGGM